MFYLMHQYLQIYGGGGGAFEAPPPGPGTPKKSPGEIGLNLECKIQEHQVLNLLLQMSVTFGLTKLPQILIKI